MNDRSRLDQWPTLKGNNRRSSNSALSGNITKPKVVMETQFGNFKGYFAVIEDKAVDRQTMQAPKAMAAGYQEIERRYEFNGLSYVVNGQILHRHDNMNYRLFHLYSPDELNLVYVTDSMELHNSVNSLVVCRVLNERLETEVLWQAELPYYHERPHIVIDDMNGDGVPEIVVEGWEGVTVYDIGSHEPIMDFPQSLLHHSRKRGYVMTRDLNGDGFPEVLILSCYPWDVNVIHNDGVSLSKNWFKIYDDHIESAQTITAYTRTPVCDCNDDGRDEMIFNIWNEQGDGQWHVKILDAFTGEEVADIPNAYLHDMADIDRDGKLELFLSEPAGIDVPEYSRIFLRHLDGSVIYTSEKSKWGYNFDSFRNEQLAVHPGQESQQGLKYVVTGQVGDEACFYVYQDTGMHTTVTRHTVSGCDRSFQIQYSRGNQVSLIKSRRNGQLLLCWETKYEHPQNFILSGIRLEALCWGIPTDQQIKLPIIANMNGDGNSIIVPNSVGQVVSYEASNGALHERWFTDGFGAAEQYKSQIDFGVVADDFLGNRQNQVAVRINGKGGGIKLVDASGAELWKTEFPLIPSGSPSGFRGILGYYTSANANGRKVLVVSGQRNVQHTGITYGLDGRSGKQLWSHDAIRKGQLHESGAGSFYLTAWDMDGDGVDEVLTGYGNNVWAAKSDTGEILFQNFMRGFWVDRWIKNYRAGWVASISPIPLSRDGRSSRFFFGNAGDSHGAAVIELNDENGLEDRCRLVWGNEQRTYTDRTHQCEFHYRDRKLIVEPAYLNGSSTIHALDPLTGEEAGAPYTLSNRELAVPIACDIDGDGEQEIVFTSGSALTAIRFTGEEWRAVWQLAFPTLLSWPAFGDVDGDGYGEIVVTGTNGFLYIVGQEGA